LSARELLSAFVTCPDTPWGLARFAVRTKRLAEHSLLSSVNVLRKNLNSCSLHARLLFCSGKGTIFTYM